MYGGATTNLDHHIDAPAHSTDKLMVMITGKPVDWNRK